MTQMKRCSKCGVEQPFASFDLKSATTGLRRSHCRTCSRSYSHDHYLRNRPAYIARARARQRSDRDRFWKLLESYFVTHPCADCGETDPIVLELDHRDPSTKIDAVSNLMRRQFKWETILAEIEKCDVRCVNCHRRRTVSQFRWWGAANAI